MLVEREKRLADTASRYRTVPRATAITKPTHEREGDHERDYESNDYDYDYDYDVVSGRR